MPVQPNVVTFWYGGSLHRIHSLCVGSWLRLGFSVTLYSYHPVDGVPDGVRHADARDVLPERTLDRLEQAPWLRQTNRPLLHLSDLFRMRLQRLGRGLWLDTDVLLLRSLEIDPALPFFAWESRRLIGNAAVYLPRDHPICHDYAHAVEADPFDLDWLPLRLQARRAWWTILRRRFGPQDLGTLIFGPMALTRLAKRHGCASLALPPCSFYTFSRSHAFFDPCDVTAIVDDPRVLGIHIQRKARWDAPPVPGSLFDWALRNIAE